MTLDDYERQNRGFMDFFWRFRAATQVYIIHKAAPRYYHYVHFGMTVIKVFYFVPNSRKSDQTETDFRCTIAVL